MNGKELLSVEIDPIRERVTPEVYTPSEDVWEQIVSDIVAVEQAEFGEEGFDEEYLKDEFNLKQNTAVILKDPATEKVIGFTFACPIGEIEEERAAESESTAYIEDTVLHPDYRGHYLVGKMMEKLEARLREKGFAYIERDSSVNNNYAANVAKTYADRIVLQGEPHDSEWGQQVRFRIRL